jgi:hypothetical protein
MMYHAVAEALVSNTNMWLGCTEPVADTRWRTAKDFWGKAF